MLKGWGKEVRGRGRRRVGVMGVGGRRGEVS